MLGSSTVAFAARATLWAWTVRTTGAPGGRGAEMEPGLRGDFGAARIWVTRDTSIPCVAGSPLATQGEVASGTSPQPRGGPAGPVNPSSSPTRRP